MAGWSQPCRRQVPAGAVALSYRVRHPPEHLPQPYRDRPLCSRFPGLQTVPSAHSFIPPSTSLT